ncbi:MAG TPA: hypothetical protein DEP84_11425, partial [Chloroflexi bacterium]|nr:hypothetical protein [Chloroflexota bacterium]
LLRRAARYAADRAPGLNELLIERNGATYHYEIPSAWHEAGNEQALSALAALGDELVPILLELTGSIVIHRLERFSSLREVGIRFSKESAS